AGRVDEYALVLRLAAEEELRRHVRGSRDSHATVPTSSYSPDPTSTSVDDAPAPVTTTPGRSATGRPPSVTLPPGTQIRARAFGGTPTRSTIRLSRSSHSERIGPRIDS